jgi:hypothetical protein
VIAVEAIMRFILPLGLVPLYGGLAACGSSKGSGDDSAPQADDSSPGDDSGPVGDDSGPGGDDSGTNEGECGNESVPGFTTPSDPTCENTIATSKIDAELEWSMETWKVDPGSNYILSAPVVASLTDDNDDGAIDQHDTPDILVVTFDPDIWTVGTLRAVSGDGSGELWSATPMYLGTYVGVAAADIDGDGMVEVLVPVQDYTIAAFEHDGTPKWTSEQAPFDVLHWAGSGNAAHIADMDHDGTPEIVVGNTIYDNEGNFLAAGTHGYAQSTTVGSAPTTADIDGDGVDDLIGGNAVYRLDGSDLWYNGLEVAFPAVADVDLDGAPDIVVAGDGNVRIDDAAGNVLVPAVEIPSTGGSSWGGAPVVADFDGDGAPEVGVASWDNFTVFDSDLSILWSATTHDYTSGITGATAFDFDGDGSAEVVYGDEQSIWVLSGVDGSVRGRIDHVSATWLEYPIVVDVDGDREAEIVAVSNPGIQVYGSVDGSWPSGRRIWNEYGYHITNVNDDGTIPDVEAASWETHNTFRSGDLTAGEALSAPDLSVTPTSVCEEECDDGTLVVWAQVANEGAVDLGVPVRFTVYAVQGATRTVVADVEGPTGVPVGTVSDASEIRIPGFDASAAESLVVRVDSDEAECNDANNEAEIPGPFCTGD